MNTAIPMTDNEQKLAMAIGLLDDEQRKVLTDLNLIKRMLANMEGVYNDLVGHYQALRSEVTEIEQTLKNFKRRQKRLGGPIDSIEAVPNITPFPTGAGNVQRDSGIIVPG